MKETALWRLVRTNNPQVFWTRLESGSTAQGIPDTVGVYRGVTVWIEHKNGEAPSDWTPFQERWAKEGAAHGGNYYVLYGFKHGLWLYDWQAMPIYDFRKPVDSEQVRSIIWGGALACRVRARSRRE